MTQTVNIPIDGDWTDIASSNDYQLMSAQIIGDGSVEFHIDTRTVEERETAGDNHGISYAPMERTQFGSWEGTIRARAPHGDQQSVIAVILS